jgi:hypothetical protein
MVVFNPTIVTVLIEYCNQGMIGTEAVAIFVPICHECAAQPPAVNFLEGYSVHPAFAVFFRSFVPVAWGGGVVVGVFHNRKKLEENSKNKKLLLRTVIIIHSLSTHPCRILFSVRYSDDL